MSKILDVIPEEIISYTIRNGASVRETARYFGIGKSTVHNILKNYNGSRKEEIESVLKKNSADSRFKKNGE